MVKVFILSVIIAITLSNFITITPETPKADSGNRAIATQLATLEAEGY